MMVIGYVLNNPVRAKLVRNFSEYHWSSANLYFTGKPSEIVDGAFVAGLFGSKENLRNVVENLSIDKLFTMSTRMGKVIGGKEFINQAVTKFDRRKNTGQTLAS